LRERPFGRRAFIEDVEVAGPLLREQLLQTARGSKRDVVDGAGGS
jgi:hypothetical protein